MKSENSLEKIKKTNLELKKIKADKEDLEEKLSELRRQIKNSERKLGNLKRSDSWRERTHRLIEYGALLEIAEIIGEDKSILLGYFLSFRQLSETEKEDLRIKGTLEFRKREEKKAEARRRMEENRANYKKETGDE